MTKDENTRKFGICQPVTMLREGALQASGGSGHSVCKGLGEGVC